MRPMPVCLFRVPDDFVDETCKHDLVKAQEVLLNWRDEWRLRGLSSTNPFCVPPLGSFTILKIPTNIVKHF